MKMEHAVKSDVIQLLELRRKQKVHRLISDIKSAESVEGAVDVSNDFVRQNPAPCRVLSYLAEADEKNFDGLLRYLRCPVGVTKLQVDRLKKMRSVILELDDKDIAVIASMKVKVKEYTEALRKDIILAFQLGESVTLTHGALSILLGETFDFDNLYKSEE